MVDTIRSLYTWSRSQAQERSENETVGRGRATIWSDSKGLHTGKLIFVNSGKNRADWLIPPRSRQAELQNDLPRATQDALDANNFGTGLQRSVMRDHNAEDFGRRLWRIIEKEHSAGTANLVFANVFGNRLQGHEDDHRVHVTLRDIARIHDMLSPPKTFSEVSDALVNDAVTGGHGDSKHVRFKADKDGAMSGL